MQAPNSKTIRKAYLLLLEDKLYISKWHSWSSNFSSTYSECKVPKNHIYLLLYVYFKVGKLEVVFYSPLYFTCFIWLFLKGCCNFICFLGCLVVWISFTHFVGFAIGCFVHQISSINFVSWFVFRYHPFTSKWVRREEVVFDRLLHFYLFSWLLTFSGYHSLTLIVTRYRPFVLSVDCFSDIIHSLQSE